MFSLIVKGTPCNGPEVLAAVGGVGGGQCGVFKHECDCVDLAVDLDDPVEVSFNHFTAGDLALANQSGQFDGGASPECDQAWMISSVSGSSG